MGCCMFWLNFCHPTAITILPNRSEFCPLLCAGYKSWPSSYSFPHSYYHSRSPSEDSISPRTKMRFSFPAVFVALTASMSVSACSTSSCKITSDCCANYVCGEDVSVISLPCIQDPTTSFTLHALEWSFNLHFGPKLSQQLEWHVTTVSHVSSFTLVPWLMVQY
ncbi:hypothetical protein EDB19DRAFT_1704071 [Suillus lakei]|nr:hypothetical protein EDB19DRAFT_1704071 [Suillus lakei]